MCPECFEATLSLENLGTGEQKKKAAPEVRKVKAKEERDDTLWNVSQRVHNSLFFFCLDSYQSADVSPENADRQCQAEFSSTQSFPLKDPKTEAQDCTY